ncbi:MAG: GDSL-type esterase/lipase family protein [Kiloniellales bacterium]|nr:GDSL-type esterase/lipase family protein [Kiloniellales bacterium]
MKSICFLGASTTEGLGDETGQGWVGRLVTLSTEMGALIVYHNLGVRGETLREIAARGPRLCRDCLSHRKDRLIVLSSGLNDIARLENGKQRTPERVIARRYKALCEALMDIAPLMIVGPPPVLEEKLPYHSETSGHRFNFKNEDVRKLCALYEAIARDLGLPYLPVFSSMQKDEDYLQGLSANDGLHPDGRGYQKLAIEVLNWPRWKEAVIRPARTKNEPSL